MTWLKKELDYLKKSYALLSVDEISANLYYLFNTYRTDRAIRSKVLRLGLTKLHPRYKKNQV